MRHFVIALGIVLWTGGVRAQAEPILGLWLTERDAKGQVAHVEAARCGARFCGTVLRAFDRNGKPVVTPAVGRMVFWDMRRTGPGEYSGRAFVPAHQREYDGIIRVDGDRMKVGGCFGPVCLSQTWRRVR